MKLKKRVLVITSHYPPNIGGVESHLQALVNGLAKRGWGVIISTYQPLAYSNKAKAKEESREAIIYRQNWIGFNIVHKLTPYPALEFMYLFPGLFLGTLKVILKHKSEIDIIHCQGLVPSTIGVILGGMFSKRVICSTHNLYFFPKKGLYSMLAALIFNTADLVLVATETAKKELIRVGVKLGKIDFFKYWINLKVFSPVNKKLAKEKLNQEGFVVFFVGRLIVTKGVGIILDMVKDLKNGIKVVIAGSGAMEEEVRKASQKYSDRLIFLGRIENSQLPIYYSAADLIVVPSTVDEGWGFVVMEAVACGTPVVVSNKGGLSDVVSLKVGKIVPATVKDFKKSVEDLYNHPAELKRLQENCRKYAELQFGESNIDEIVRFYDSLSGNV